MPGGDPGSSVHGQEEHREVAATAHETFGRLARRSERAVVQLSQPSEHLIGITSIDLSQPLGSDPLFQWPFGAVMDDQSALDAPHVGEVVGNVSQPAGHAAWVGDRALPGVVAQILRSHRSSKTADT